VAADFVVDLPASSPPLGALIAKTNTAQDKIIKMDNCFMSRLLSFG
jgi:hypothetical protein